MQVWPFTPNWEEPVTERLSWLTDVQRSSSGAELRRALRLSPRRSFEGSVIAHGAERTLFDLWVHTRGSTDFALPIWPDVQLLANAVPGGATFIPCRTQGFDFVNGGQAVLRGDSMQHTELLTVSTAMPDGLVLAAETVRSWPLGTRLYPVRKARFAALPEVTRKTDTLLTADIHVELQEACDWPEILPTLSYRNVPVLAQRPDESQDLSRGFERLTQLLDNNVGISQVTDTAGVGFVLQQHRWLLKGRQEHSAWRSLLYGLRGRQRVCWLPSHAADMVPVSSIGSTLTVERCGYATHAPLAPGRRDVRIEMHDGSTVHRRITAAATAVDTEDLVLDGPVPAASAIARVSFMALARLAGDDIEIEYLTDADGVARVATNWRSVRDDLEALP